MVVWGLGFRAQGLGFGKKGPNDWVLGNLVRMIVVFGKRTIAGGLDP